jgi:hypothetical protein
MDADWQAIMDNNDAKIRKAGLPETKVIFYQAEVSLRSSCYPVSEHIRMVMIKIGNKELIDSQARVYDRNEKLLFNLDINGDEVLLDMKNLQTRGGILQFKNNYFIYIN